MDLVGLRCVVTGAASGIGDAAARHLIDRGATVACLDLNAPTAPAARFERCDLSDPRSIDAAVDALGPGWDVLCNVAGVPGTADPTLVLKINVLGLRHLTESMVDGLADGGSIVNMASVAGSQWPMNLPAINGILATASFEEGVDWLESNPVESAYNFSKEALIVYTMRLSQRGWNRGIRANPISPGPVDTPILSDFEESMGKAQVDGVKLFVGRHAVPADIAPAVGFLASPGSAWVNGANLVMDGGFLAAAMSGLIPIPEG